MKKMFKCAMIALMSLTLLAGCVTAGPHEPLPTPIAHQTYKLEVINATNNFAIAIACVVRVENGAPTGECLFDPIALYPKHIVDNNPGKNITNKVTLDLLPGQYAFLILGYDIRTGKQSRSEMMGEVLQDGQLIFQEKSMSVGDTVDA